MEKTGQKFAREVLKLAFQKCGRRPPIVLLVEIHKPKNFKGGAKLANARFECTLAENCSVIYRCTHSLQSHFLISCTDASVTRGYKAGAQLTSLPIFWENRASLQPSMVFRTVSKDALMQNQRCIN